MVLSVVQNTPVWVWLVLAVTIWFGVRGLKPRSTALWQIALIPAVAAVWSVWKIASAEPLGPVLVTWSAALLLGAAIGFRWGSSTPLQRADEGRIDLPGTRVWLVAGLVVFGLYYALNVYLALHREMRTVLFWVAAPYALGGFVTGITSGRLLGLLNLRRVATH